MHDAAVVTESLTRSFGDRRALDGVDLEVPGGVLFGLLGPNGGGKSTLFRILSTLLPPTSGSASVFEHDVERDAARVRESIGVVFQAPSVDKKLTVRENLLHQGHLYGLAGASVKTRIDDLLVRFGLSDRASDKVGDLSGGLARRVEVAKGMIHKPRLLLLDEPSTGLDPAARRELAEQLADVRDNDGTTILLTTHILEEADECLHAFLRERVALQWLLRRKKHAGEICAEVRVLVVARRRDELLEEAQRFGGVTPEPSSDSTSSVRFDVSDERPVPAQEETGRCAMRQKSNRRARGSRHDNT